MKISTKGRYGVRFMLDLAQHHETGSVTLKDVARRQAVSEKYLWQVITPLKAAGLIRTVRGAHGGYALAKPPPAITIYDVVATLEGGCTVVDCVKAPATCQRSAACAAREVWRDVEARIKTTLSATTLHDLARQQQAVDSKSELAYSI